MNKTIKSLVAVTVISLAAGSAIFAAPKNTGKGPEDRPAIERPKMERPAGERPQDDRVIKTITGKVKVNNKGFVTFEAKDGNTYVLTTERGKNPEEKSMFTTIKNRNNKQLILSGFVNEDTNVFTVIKIGGMDSEKTDK